MLGAKKGHSKIKELASREFAIYMVNKEKFISDIHNISELHLCPDTQYFSMTRFENESNQGFAFFSVFKIKKEI